MRVPNVAINALLLVVSCLGTYVAVEIVFRFYMYHHVRDQLVQIVLSSLGGDFCQFDSDFGFRYTPNRTYKDIAIYKNEFSINEYGFIANDLDRTRYAEEKPKDEYRIAILGDSFTIGYQNNVRWPDLVQDYLNRSPIWRAFVGGKFTRVLNFGLDGTGFVQWGAVYEFAARRFSPDLVIVNFVTDDIHRKFIFRGQVDLSQKAAIRKRVETDILSLLPWYDWYPGVLAATAGPHLGLEPRLTAAAAYSRFRYIDKDEAVKQSIVALDRIRSFNSNLLIFQHPLREEMDHPDDDTERRWPHFHLMGLETKFLGAAKEHKFDVVKLDKRNPVPKSPNRILALFNYPIDGHNSDYGVAVYASWVFRYLLDWPKAHSSDGCAGTSCSEATVGRTQDQSPVLTGCKVITEAKCPGVPGVMWEGVDLRGHFLAMADLSGANLKGADLTDLNLWKTRLPKADLSGAKMKRAFLTGDDLRGANLQGADLRQAFLFRAQADGANFQGALLEGARWLTGVICGPGSVGECLPLPPTADYDPPTLTWHLDGSAPP